jgi:hypothetical protein
MYVNTLSSKKNSLKNADPPSGLINNYEEEEKTLAHSP